MLEINNLTKKYNDKIVLNNITLDIKDNELFALLGMNGAGKTTMLKILSTLILPTSGKLKINGLDIKDDILKIKEIINISPQETAIALNLTVKENLDFIAGIYRISNKYEKINELVNKFNLNDILNQKCKTLSGGQKRKLSIALSLINNPKVLFLDEPTLGLDVIARKELWNIIKELKSSMTIILTTHYMEEAEYLSDRVGILNNGILKCLDTPKGIIYRTNSNNLEEAFIKIVKEGAL